jgi:hypothetical protein
MTRNLNKVAVRVEAALVSRQPMNGFVIWHAYPTLADWPAGAVSDAINPRSHDENVLDSAVSEAIRRTASEDAGGFILANRGILLLAGSAEYHDGVLTVGFEGNPALRGLADGGTTDATLAALAHRPLDARVHVEVLVGLDDPDEVAKLVEGRNTSRQVRQSSLVNASGRFEWLKQALPAEIRAHVAWEENASGAIVPVSEVLGLLAMFRPGAGDPTAGAGASRRLGHINAWAGSAAAAYRDRSKIAATLRDEGVLADFQKTAPLAADVLRLYDDIWLALVERAEAAVNKTRSAAKEAKWDKAFPPAKAVSTPFTGRPSPRKVPSGWLFPAVGACRQFVEGGRLAAIPVESLAEIIEHVVMWVEGGHLNADKFAKLSTSYQGLYIGVRVQRKEG